MTYATSTESGENITINTNDHWAPDPVGPFQLVRDRFEATLANSEDMLAKLVGPGGYLDQMAAVVGVQPDISSLVPPGFDATVVLDNSGLTAPVFDKSSLVAFPNETYTIDPLSPLPDIPTTGLDSINKPAAPANASLAWTSENYVSNVFTVLLTRILDDLQSGATGLDPVVEAAIYQRAKTRQAADRQAEWERVNNTAAQLQFQLPSGVLASGLTDFSIGANRQDADIENNIIATQADLAQKNSQFIIQQATAIETILRQFHSDKENRSLDFEKNRVDVLVREYAERVRGFATEIEGEKTRIQAMVEMLRGAIEANRAKVDKYKEQYAALSVRIAAVSAQNDSLVKTFQGEIQGYSEAEKATAAKNESLVRRLVAQVSAAELDLRANIAKIDAIMSGYTSDMTVRERIATSMANIASQTVASWASAVNASAGLSYNAGESISETRSQSKSISIAHSYEHDPVT